MPEIFNLRSIPSGSEALIGRNRPRNTSGACRRSRATSRVCAPKSV